MRDLLKRIDFAAQIVIGVGEKEQSHGVVSGEVVGLRRERSVRGASRLHEICVDTLVGTRSALPLIHVLANVVRKLDGLCSPGVSPWTNC